MRHAHLSNCRYIYQIFFIAGKATNVTVRLVMDSIDSVDETSMVSFSQMSTFSPRLTPRW